MARLPRFNIAGYTQHVFIRGNNKQIVFNEDKDYVLYLEKLDEACKRFHCELHSYALLDNQVHLLITPSDEKGISKVMQTLGRYYVQYFNFKYDRSGTLWEGRYRATLVDTQNHMLDVQKFIEQSPSRLKKEDMTNYPWTSFQQNAFSKSGVHVTPHKSLYHLFSDPIQYQSEFSEPLSEEKSQKVEKACFKGWILGSDDFIQEVEKTSGRRAMPLPKGGDRRSEKYKASMSLSGSVSGSIPDAGSENAKNQMPHKPINADAAVGVDLANEKPQVIPVQPSTLKTNDDDLDGEVNNEVSETETQVSPQPQPVQKPKVQPTLKPSVKKAKKEAEVQKSFDDMTQQSLF